MPAFTRRAVAQAIYRGLLGREPTPDDLTGMARYLAGQGLDEAFRAAIASREFREAMVKALVPAASLPDLKRMLPDHFVEEVTDYAETMTVFRAAHDADFDVLENLIQTHRYYDAPNVWNAQIDTDKKVTAAIAQGLGGRRCLELGCFTGAVISRLADAGAEVTGLDASHLAFAFAYPNIRDRMVFGDLLTADLAGGYDVVLAMDVLEHLNPLRFPSYLARIASLVADDGYVYVNAPMFGADEMFGVVFPPYLKEWSAVGDRSFWRHLDCDALGWPKHGHLVWAAPIWWERSFADAGFVRAREIEAAIHRRLARFFEGAPARKCLFVLRRAGNQRASAPVAEAIAAAIDGVGEAV